MDFPILTMLIGINSYVVKIKTNLKNSFMEVVETLKENLFKATQSFEKLQPVSKCYILEELMVSS
ncbi:hypothetical protein [Xylocopilactobacillus apis]|uniref:Transposase n=1 Tax=Xylocopilactobacillus apis TaxID=2932183 RepID=A0AAU9DFQ6_9LACO|nr:hypothetical protein [Xylocopilactobacillus apis]BDR55542.1 hypothetical protein KIMC2_01040 [Xylocopilactobacillus apis]